MSVNILYLRHHSTFSLLAHKVFVASLKRLEMSVSVKLLCFWFSCYAQLRSQVAQSVRKGQKRKLTRETHFTFQRTASAAAAHPVYGLGKIDRPSTKIAITTLVSR